MVWHLEFQNFSGGNTPGPSRRDPHPSPARPRPCVGALAPPVLGHRLPNSDPKNPKLPLHSWVTLSAAVRLSLTTTPCRIRRLDTRSMSRRGGCTVSGLAVKTISSVLSRFSFTVSRLCPDPLGSLQRSRETYIAGFLMFGALKPGFRSLTTLKLVVNVVGEI